MKINIYLIVIKTHGKHLMTLLKNQATLCLLLVDLLLGDQVKLILKIKIICKIN